MPLLDNQKAVETLEFAARVTVHSGLTPLLETLSSQPEVVALVTEAKTANGRRSVLARLATISEFAVDAGYANPADIAMTAYLLALAATDRTQAQAGAAAALRAPNCWWSRRLATHVLKDELALLPLAHDLTQWWLAQPLFSVQGNVEGNDVSRVFSAPVGMGPIARLTGTTSVRDSVPEATFDFDAGGGLGACGTSNNNVHVGNTPGVLCG